MNSEARSCQNCKQNFVIEPDDFAFYEKIQVPAPTFCPECRMQRRLAWRNERSLYKRKCNAPGHNEEIISIYSPDKSIIAYDQKYWWSDEWDPLEYGKAYDFSKPFFNQFHSLLKSVPFLALSNYNSTNSEYCNFIDNNKNCYLIFGSFYDENVAYSNKVQYSKDSFDLLMAKKNELCYECVNCVESYRLLWSVNSKSCTDSYFLYNCRNCSNCFGCVNLISKSFYIFNQPYSKDEYFKKIVDFKINSWSGVESIKEKFRKEILLNAIHKYANIVGSNRVTGDNILNSKNAVMCFDVYDSVEDCKYLYHSLNQKEAYDGMGQYKNDFSCENVDNDVGNRTFGTLTVYNSNHAQYSFNCHGCSYIFGCIGLRKKQYCILNRQYTKEEYSELIPRIITHMNEMPYIDKGRLGYRYGEFFPTEISLCAYNETIAQEYFPLTKEETLEKGYGWKDPETRDYKITKNPDDLPDHVKDVDDSILKEVIGCAHQGKCNEQCTTAFKIIESELQFYRRMNLPLPRLCPNCRHYQRLKQRNPLKLWHRQCMCDYQIYQNTIKHRHHPEGRCPNEFETSYAPERPEIVYCEQCYNAEVV